MKTDRIIQTPVDWLVQHHPVSENTPHPAHRWANSFARPDAPFSSVFGGAPLRSPRLRAFRAYPDATAPRGGSSYLHGSARCSKRPDPHWREDVVESDEFADSAQLVTCEVGFAGEKKGVHGRGRDRHVVEELSSIVIDGQWVGSVEKC